MRPSEAEITKEEFCARFKARMLAVAADEHNASDLAHYADKAAVNAWDDPHMRAEGPEDCADVDISYWEN